MSHALVAPSDRLLATVVTERGGAARLAGAVRDAGLDVVVVGADRFDPADHGGPRVDPSVVALELGRVAPELGVLVAVAPTRDHPYNTARRILSIDHLLGGRAGVLLGGPDRYTVPAASGTAWGSAPEDDRLLDEYAAVLRGLWSTWPVESIVADRETGVYAESGSIRRLDHEGSWRIAGALTSPTSPQGEPVLAVLSGLGPVPHADLVVDVLRVDDLDAIGRDGSDPRRTSRPNGPNESTTLRTRLGLAPRRLDLTDARPAFATTGGTR
jgi:alkanesulfonate monooxygenase SsuD/methylene tetrahydromethanopterin reductase-like flavin-dependent oxidoreductase (luciferase family)